MANNFSAMGPFLTLSQGVPGSQVRRVIRIATFSNLLIMLGAYVLGTAVLQFFGLSVSAFQIAGALLLGFSGLSISMPPIRVIRTRRTSMCRPWMWGR